MTDASSNDNNINSDVDAYWGPLAVSHYSCPLPQGWSATGTYYWQTNYALFVAGATAYAGITQGALTYISNFTGVGRYTTFDSALAPIFGVYKSGSAFSAVCGGTPAALGVFPNAKWVELRPLNGFGDIIVRDAAGNILARYGCRYTADPAYVGFSAASGQWVKVYSIEAWG